MNARIVQIINEHNTTVSQFAIDIGCNRLTVQRWINGQHSIGSDLLIAINKLYPDVNLHWLLTGEMK